MHIGACKQQQYTQIASLSAARMPLTATTTPAKLPIGKSLVHILNFTIFMLATVFQCSNASISRGCVVVSNAAPATSVVFDQMLIILLLLLIQPSSSSSAAQN